jgi:hypothetical protein
MFNFSYKIKRRNERLNSLITTTLSLTHTHTHLLARSLALSLSLSPYSHAAWRSGTWVSHYTCVSVVQGSVAGG